jgi:hypothetical protein
LTPTTEVVLPVTGQTPFAGAAWAALRVVLLLVGLWVALFAKTPHEGRD